jgi:hypothetical protein
MGESRFRRQTGPATGFPIEAVSASEALHRCDRGASQQRDGQRSPVSGDNR